MPLKSWATCVKTASGMFTSKEYARDNGTMHRIVTTFIHGTTQMGRDYGSLKLSKTYVFHNPLLLITRKNKLSLKKF